MSEAKKTSRVPEIELMKAVAIIGMVLVHTLEASWDSLSNADSGPGYLVFYLIEFTGGVFCSGGFMFAMGWGAAYSKRSTVQTFLTRLVKLLLLGLVVNFFEIFVPGIIDPAGCGPVSDFYYAILAVDIYYYAALFMLYFAVMKHFEDNTAVQAVISGSLVAVFVIVNTMVTPEGFSSGNDWLDTLMGLFVRENEYSYFPIVTWGIYPIMGYWLCRIYKKWDDRRRFAMLLAALGIPALVVSEILVTRAGLPHEILNPGGYDEFFFYAMDTRSMLGGFGLICLELLLYMGIVALAGGRVHPGFLYLGKNVTFIYVVQWMILGVIYPSMAQVTSIWVNAGIGLTVLFAVIIICLCKDRLFVNRRKQ
ncbi:MAG: acyltransferase [Lachnospiraceae bacterium]|nr:acyltransferase [Lachnospiraceae bacterium]